MATKFQSTTNHDAEFGLKVDATFTGAMTIVHDVPLGSMYRLRAVITGDHHQEFGKLFAAAPDYDKAARMAVESAAPLNADESDFGPVIIDREAYDALRAAIKATEG